jgi:hypothetical protein
MCLFVLLGALVPRVTLVLLWLVKWTEVLNPWWLGLLGFFFMPYTTLAYVLISRWDGAVSTSNMVHVVLMLIAVICDVGAWGGGHRHYRTRRV